MRLRGDDLVKWLREAYFSLDGIWFLTLEERLGLERAVELDVEVWRRFAHVMARRVAKRFGIDSTSPEGIASSLEVFFDVEGWSVSLDPSSGSFKVEHCPWWEYLNRVGRSHIISYVCPKVCEVIFSSWAKALNPGAQVSFDFNPPKCKAEVKVEEA